MSRSQPELRDAWRGSPKFRGEFARNRASPQVLSRRLGWAFGDQTRAEHDMHMHAIIINAGAISDAQVRPIQLRAARKRALINSINPAENVCSPFV